MEVFLPLFLPKRQEIILVSHIIEQKWLITQQEKISHYAMSDQHKTDSVSSCSSKRQQLKMSWYETCRKTKFSNYQGNR